jgi:chromatin remodeling complex protein RSC6
MPEKNQGKSKRRPSLSFMKPVTPDPELAEIVGNEPIPRTDVIRRLWDYIRGNNLQDPQNKTFIKADEKLRKIFGGKDRVSMFEMTKLVFSHVT